jgi:hypothetical protein
MGWPKLLRLVVLVTPAALLLAAFAMRHLAEVSGAKVKLNVPVVIASVVLGLGIAAEIAQGLMTTLVHRHDIIVSMWRAAAAVGPRP